MEETFFSTWLRLVKPSEQHIRSGFRQATSVPTAGMDLRTAQILFSKENNNNKIVK